jgi:hypothetical protein
MSLLRHLQEDVERLKKYALRYEKLYDAMQVEYTAELERLRRDCKVAQVRAHYGNSFHVLPILEVHRGAHGFIVTVGNAELGEK